MDKTITLNNIHMKLLKDFMKAEKTLESAKEFFKKVDVAESVDEAGKLLRKAYENRESAACVFAMSVAAEVK